MEEALAQYSTPVRNFFYDKITPLVPALSLLDVPLLPYNEHPKVLKKDKNWIRQYQHYITKLDTKSFDIPKVELDKRAIADLFLHYMVKPIVHRHQLNGVTYVLYRQEQWKMLDWEKSDVLDQYILKFIQSIFTSANDRPDLKSSKFVRLVRNEIIYWTDEITDPEDQKIATKIPRMFLYRPVRVEPKGSWKSFWRQFDSASLMPYPQHYTPQRWVFGELLGIWRWDMRAYRFYGSQRTPNVCFFRDRTFGLIISEDKSFEQAFGWIKMIEDFQTKGPKITAIAFQLTSKDLMEDPKNIEYLPFLRRYDINHLHRNVMVIRIRATDVD